MIILFSDKKYLGTLSAVLRYLIIPLTLILCSILEANPGDYWKHKIDQGHVGSCHSFATLALVEAEYKCATGKHIDLSERELFVRHYLNDYGSFEKLINSQFERATRRTVTPHYKEAGHITDNFKLLQTHGVSTEKELPYSSLFKMGVPEAMRTLRHCRHAVTREMFLSRKAGTWNDSKKSSTLKKHKQQSSVSALSPIFTLPQNTTSQEMMKQFCNELKLIKISPSTTPKAKQIITSQLAHHPVAVNVSNYIELTGSTAHSLYERHSLVVSCYHPERDTFTIRSSTRGNGKEVDANALARGTYQIYYLVKK